MRERRASLASLGQLRQSVADRDETIRQLRDDLDRERNCRTQREQSLTDAIGALQLTEAHLRQELQHERDVAEAADARYAEQLRTQLHPPHADAAAQTIAEPKSVVSVACGTEPKSVASIACETTLSGHLIGRLHEGAARWKEAYVRATAAEKKLRRLGQESRELWDRLCDSQDATLAARREADGLRAQLEALKGGASSATRGAKRPRNDEVIVYDHKFSLVLLRL